MHLSLSLIKAEFLLDRGLLASKNWFPNPAVPHSSIAFLPNGEYGLGITILNSNFCPVSCGFEFSLSLKVLRWNRWPHISHTSTLPLSHASSLQIDVNKQTKPEFLL